MLINYEEMTDDDVEAFVEGFKNAGGFVGDLDSPSPWCCPFYTDDKTEVEGDTPAQWGANYWRKHEKEIVEHLVADARHINDDARNWLIETYRYQDDSQVYVVDKAGEIEKTTRGAVLNRLGFDPVTDFGSEAVATALDNAGLIDFETLEDAKRHVSELPKEED